MSQFMFEGENNNYDDLQNYVCASCGILVNDDEDLTVYRSHCEIARVCKDCLEEFGEPETTSCPECKKEVYELYFANTTASRKADEKGMCYTCLLDFIDKNS